MYIYYVFVNALGAHIIHINLNKYNILYVRRGQSYQNNLHKVLYGNAHTYTHTQTHTQSKRTTSFTPDHAYWCRFTTTHSDQHSGKPENPDHMISDVADDIEACLQMA